MHQTQESEKDIELEDFDVNCRHTRVKLNFLFLIIILTICAAGIPILSKVCCLKSLVKFSNSTPCGFFTARLKIPSNIFSSFSLPGDHGSLYHLELTCNQEDYLAFETVWLL